MHKSIPEGIEECLSYCPNTGIIKWIKAPNCNSQVLGREWGRKSNDGYRRARYNGKAYKAHRVAWYLMTGEDPGELTVDHIDGDRLNNRFENLRLLPFAQQKRNLGALGYSVLDDITPLSERALLSQIRDKSGKKRYLGRHMCPLLARVAYHDAAAAIFPSTPFLPRAEIKGNPNIHRIIAKHTEQELLTTTAVGGVSRG